MEETRTGGDVQADLAVLKADIQKVRADLAVLAGDVVARGKESAAKAKVAVAAAASQTLEKTQECIQERPIQAILVTLGAGILIGAAASALICRSRRD